ncbi:hypothetical protein ACLB2K_059968 [Fragaria x ananassa]
MGEETYEQGGRSKRRHTNREAEASGGRRRRREQAKQNHLYLSVRPLLRRKPQKHVFSEPSLPSRARPQCRSNFKALRRGEVTSRPSRSPKARRGDFASKQARQCVEAEAQKQKREALRGGEVTSRQSRSPKGWRGHIRIKAETLRRGEVTSGQSRSPKGWQGNIRVKAEALRGGEVTSRQGVVR